MNWIKNKVSSSVVAEAQIYYSAWLQKMKQKSLTAKDFWFAVGVGEKWVCEKHLLGVEK